MGGIFNLDSPLMQVLGKVADLMILNILAMICCIPIVTAGASLTALHYMSLKIVRGEESYIARGFFKSFKQNFKQATVIWLLILLALFILVADFYIMQNSGIEFHIVLKVIIGIGGLLIIFTATYVFAVLAKFDNTIKRTIKNALIMSLLQFPKTILMIIMALVPVAIAVFFPQVLPIVFLFGMSGPALVAALLYNKFFKKLEDQVEAANAPDEVEVLENPEEDERIFRDELDEALIQSEMNKQ